MRVPASSDWVPEQSNGRARSTTAMWIGFASMTRWALSAEDAMWDLMPIG